MFVSPKAFCASCLADPSSLYITQQRSMKPMQDFMGDLQWFKTSAWEQVQGLGAHLSSQHTADSLLPTCCSVHPAFSSCQTSFCLTTTNHPFLSESHKGDRSTGNSAYPMYGLEFWGSWSKAQILETWWLIFHLLWELGLIKDLTYFYEHCYVKIICLAQWVPLMLWECNVIFCCCFSKSLSTVNLCTVTHRGELPP